MATKKNAVTKKSAQSTKSPTPPKGLELFKLETGIPVPPRGQHDPQFIIMITGVLKDMKPKQSFAFPKKKQAAISKIAKNDFPKYKMRFSTIQPDKKFVRVFRLE